jgi:hypothetical protein
MLDEQIQQIIDKAIDHVVPPSVIEKSVAPILKSYAQKVSHEAYYLVVNQKNDLLIRIIQSSLDPSKEKRVIYAFADSNTGLKFLSSPTNSLKLIPITHLLFDLFAIESWDELIFVDPMSKGTTVEIKRLEIFQDIQKKIKEQFPPLNYC